MPPRKAADVQKLANRVLQLAPKIANLATPPRRILMAPQTRNLERSDFVAVLAFGLATSLTKLTPDPLWLKERAKLLQLFPLPEDHRLCLLNDMTSDYLSTCFGERTH